LLGFVTTRPAAVVDAPPAPAADVAVCPGANVVAGAVVAPPAVVPVVGAGAVVPGTVVRPDEDEPPEHAASASVNAVAATNEARRTPGLALPIKSCRDIPNPFSGGENRWRATAHSSARR
jgi:hypothetical protein